MDNKLSGEGRAARVSSPEELNDYVKVSSPGVWAVLAAVVVLLIGVCVWGIWGRLESTAPAVVISRGGEAVCCCAEEYISRVEPGMAVRAGDAELRIAALPGEAVELYSAAPEAGFEPGQAGYVLPLEGEAAEGVYEAEIVLESVSPISFLWN